MKSLLTLAVLALAVGAQAGELDRDQPNVGASDSTIVVRVDTQTGAVEKLELNQGLEIDQAKALAENSSAQFEKVAPSKIKSELDQEAGASSWFWFCPTYYSAPSYGYDYYNTGFYNYGNWYTNYYSYRYDRYNYYYYEPSYGNGGFDDYGDVFERNRRRYRRGY